MNKNPAGGGLQNVRVFEYQIYPKAICQALRYNNPSFHISR